METFQKRKFVCLDIHIDLNLIIIIVPHSNYNLNTYTKLG